jgi:hypothetical protein
VTSPLVVARRVVYAAAALGVVLRAEAAVAAADASVEPHVKAAFLYNFVKFVEWADNRASNGPVMVCVAGSPAVAASLKGAAQQYRADGRELAVQQVTSDSLLRACQLVYIADSDEQRARHWLVALTGSTAFTVSDCDRFARLGGVANFFVQDGRLRFAINLDAARRASLRISSRMLALAQIVEDEPQDSDVRISR